MAGRSQIHSDLIIYSQENKIISCQMARRAVSQEFLTSINNNKKIIFLPSEETNPSQISEEALLYWLPKLTSAQATSRKSDRRMLLYLHII